MKSLRRNFKTSVDSDGFTLLEVLIVLLVMALGSFFYLNQSSSRQNQKTPDQFLSDIKMLFYQQRLAAITSGKTQEIVVDLDKDGRLIKASDSKISIPENLQISFLTAENLVLNHQRATIEFNSDGSSTGGTLIAKSINHEAKLLINWLTGISTLKRVGETN